MGRVISLVRPENLFSAAMFTINDPKVREWAYDDKNKAWLLDLAQKALDDHPEHATATDFADFITQYAGVDTEPMK